jgi:chloride channel protein, CIC family
MNNAVAGRYVLWFLLLLVLAKMVATSLTIGIGGSGGVFAPSLFVGAMAGTAFGVTVQHLFGSIVGSPAIYGVIRLSRCSHPRRTGGSGQSPESRAGRR